MAELHPGPAEKVTGIDKTKITMSAAENRDKQTILTPRTVGYEAIAGRTGGAGFDAIETFNV